MRPVPIHLDLVALATSEHPLWESKLKTDWEPATTRLQEGFRLMEQKRDTSGQGEVKAQEMEMLGTELVRSYPITKIFLRLTGHIGCPLCVCLMGRTHSGRHLPVPRLCLAWTHVVVKTWQGS